MDESPNQRIDESTPGRSVLVAGCGFLGTAAAVAFRSAGWRVTGLTRTPEHAEAIREQSGIPTVAADLGDRDALGRALAGIPKPDVVVHCASSSHGGPDVFRSVFVKGLRHLHGLLAPEHIVFTSSTSVYAQTDGSEVDESSPAEPASATGRILREAEGIVLGNGGTVLRLAGLYGPGRSVVLRRFLDGSAVLEDGGCRWLNQIHRDDAVAAILRVAGAAWARGQVFNGADDRPLNQREAYAGLARHFGRPLPPEGPRKADRKRAWSNKRVSNRKLRATGWAPVFPSFLDAVGGLADAGP